jgi:hypothetical protein
VKLKRPGRHASDSQDGAPDHCACLSPTTAQILPRSPSSFMHIIGGIEGLVGLVILAGYTPLDRYVAATWARRTRGCISE